MKTLSTLEAYLGSLTGIDPSKLREFNRNGKNGEIIFKYGLSGWVMINNRDVTHLLDGSLYGIRYTRRGCGLESREYRKFCKRHRVR